jgi:hypothetical protein
VVPAYHGNPKLSFSKKTLLQKQQLEKRFTSKKSFGFQNLYLRTLPRFIKRFQNSNFCEINYCLGVKTTLKKWNFEKICPIQTLALFQTF